MRDNEFNETKSKLAMEMEKQKHEYVFNKLMTKRELDVVKEQPSQKHRVAEKSKFMLDNMIISIKDKAHHQKIIQEAMRKYNQGEVVEEIVKQKDDSEDVESVTLSKEEENVSDVLSMINQKMAKKTEKQKDAESQALQAFLLECEKKKILTKEILKSLKHKTLSFVN